MLELFSNVTNITWQQAVMWLIGGCLIYLAIKKDMEPTLLLPMGFGALLVNLPLSGAVTQTYDGTAEVGGGNQPHAWFVGFIDDPDHPLAFVVLVENGGSGASVAGSVAAKVLAQATAGG